MISGGSDPVVDTPRSQGCRLVLVCGGRSLMCLQAVEHWSPTLRFVVLQCPDGDVGRLTLGCIPAER